MVAPRAGAWIETFINWQGEFAAMSPPVRGRGLKRVLHPDGVLVFKSPPVRGRGLKREVVWRDTAYLCVAPRAGAWIETLGA